MRKAITRILMTTWVLVATVMLARLWLAYHYLFPPIPQPFWIWLTDLYGAADAEEVADVEDLVALAFAFAIVMLFTLAARFAWRKLENRPSAAELQ